MLQIVGLGAAARARAQPLQMARCLAHDEGYRRSGKSPGHGPRYRRIGMPTNLTGICGPRCAELIEAHGPGHVGVAENRAGEVIALPLRRAQPACVRPGRFLCATGNVRYQWQPSEVSYSTMAAEREYPAGRYLLNLTAAGRQGLALLHASGDAFTRDLADGENVLVSPASLLYWEDTVYLSLHLEFPYVPGQHVRRVFWRSSRIWLRACGPGRVVIDSAGGQAEDARTADRESFASWQRWDAPVTTTTTAE